MKGALEKICQDPFCFWGLAFSLIFLSLGVIFLAFFWPHLPPQIPLFYSRPWGEEQLASKTQLIFLPLFSFLIFASSLLASAGFFAKDPFLSQILIGTGSVLVLVLTGALFQIINLIT